MQIDINISALLLKITPAPFLFHSKIST